MKNSILIRLGLTIVLVMLLVGCGGGGGGKGNTPDFNGDNFDSYNEGEWVPANGWESSFNRRWALITGGSYSGGALRYDDSSFCFLTHAITRSDFTISIKFKMPNPPRNSSEYAALTGRFINNSIFYICYLDTDITTTPHKTRLILRKNWSEGGTNRTGILGMVNFFDGDMSTFYYTLSLSFQGNSIEASATDQSNVTCNISVIDDDPSYGSPITSGKVGFMVSPAVADPPTFPVVFDEFTVSAQ